MTNQNDVISDCPTYDRATVSGAMTLNRLLTLETGDVPRGVLAIRLYYIAN